MTKFNCDYRNQSEEYPVNPWKIADLIIYAALDIDIEPVIIVSVDYAPCLA